MVRNRSSDPKLSVTFFLLLLTFAQAVIACMCDESRIWDKITASVCCARELRLVHAARGQQSDLSEQDQMLAQRSVWFLYSLETDYAIHHGMLPVSWPPNIRKCSITSR